jgi:hypothetical protein
MEMVRLERGLEQFLEWRQVEDDREEMSWTWSHELFSRKSKEITFSEHILRGEES